MSLDIVSAESGFDLGIADTQTTKASNILSVQLGSLDYLPDFGIDLNYFLDNSIRFQNASFKAYLVEVLASQGINVSNVIEMIENLYSQYTIEITDDQNTGEFVAQ